MSKETQYPSLTKSDPPINGKIEGETPPTPPTHPGKEYKLEDFSQQAINRGQQEINYLITAVDEKIVDALKQLSYAVAKLAGDKVDLKPVDRAIEEVSAAADKVAGEFPPGCGDER